MKSIITNIWSVIVVEIFSALPQKIFVKISLKKQKNSDLISPNIHSTLCEFVKSVRNLYNNTVAMKIFFILSFLLVFLTSCGLQEANDSHSTNTQEASSQVESTLSSEEVSTLKLSASIIPIGSLLNTIGWDYVEVQTIIPAWVSPHWFDLSAKDMIRISESEKIFMTWLEHIDGFLADASSEESQIHLADWMELIEVEAHEHHDEHDDEHSDDIHHDEDEEHHEEDEHSDEHEEHDDHSSDPHVWLGKNNIIEIAESIRWELTTLLPERETYFKENTDIFISELETIYDNFESETKGKTPQEFIVFHDAYNYLMESVWMDVNLKVAFSENILHETGTAHMVELIEEVELHGIQNIFTEPQFSMGNIEQFAQKYKLSLGTLDPLWQDDSAWAYLKNIQNNLENLAKVYE